MWVAVPVSLGAECSGPPQPAVNLATRLVSPAADTPRQRLLIARLAAIIASAKLTDALRAAVSSSDHGGRQWSHEFALVAEFVDDHGWRRISGHFATLQEEAHALTSCQVQQRQELRLQARAPICRNIVACSRADYDRTNALRDLRGRPIGDALLFGTFDGGRPKSTRLFACGEEGRGGGGGGSLAEEVVYYSTDAIELLRLADLLRPTALAEGDPEVVSTWLARRAQYAVHCADDVVVEIVELLDIGAIIRVLSSSAS
jgi:hypothetical protein